jgi:hypothetical protein
MSHFGLMALYAFLVSVFFAVLWKRTRREQLRLFLQLFLGMMGAALVLAWLMFMLPAAPPAPIP